MNILFPIGTFYPAQLGGPSNLMYWLARALHEKGNNVFVGTTDYGLNGHDVVLNQWIENECGKVFYQKTGMIYFPARLIFRLVPILKKADVVHLTSLFYPLSWILALWILLTRNNCQIVWSVSGELYDEALSFHSARKKIMLYWIRKLFKRGAVFHSTSDAETTTIYKKMGTDVKIVQHPIYMYLPEKLNEKVSKHILFLGRIHPIKGLENLIKAFADIKDRKGFHLIIAGDDQDPYALELKDRCKSLGMEEFINFVGHVEGHEKEKLLSESYVMVLPSHSENFGIVVIEALAQGTPVIASQNTPWEILNSISPESWVPNDPDSLRNALERMMNHDPVEYQRIRDKALAICKNNYSMLDHIGAWEASYKRALLN